MGLICRTSLREKGHIVTREYIYQFRKSWLDYFRPYKTTIARTFSSAEHSRDSDLLNQRNILDAPDFEINGINIIGWASEVFTTGSVELKFTIVEDPFPEWDTVKRSKGLTMERDITYSLIGHFSDPKHAVLFKLTFGNG